MRAKARIGDVVRFWDGVGYVVFDGGPLKSFPVMDTTGWMSSGEAAHFMFSKLMDWRRVRMPKRFNHALLVRIDPWSQSEIRASNYRCLSPSAALPVPLERGVFLDPEPWDYPAVLRVTRTVTCRGIDITRNRDGSFLVVPTDGDEGTVESMREFARDLCREGLGKLLWPKF